MAPRSQKLLAAAVALALGLILAWPFRRTDRPAAPAQVWQATPDSIAPIGQAGANTAVSESLPQSLPGSVTLEEGLRGESVELRNTEYSGLPYLAASATSVEVDSGSEAVPSSTFAEAAPIVASPPRQIADQGIAQDAAPRVGPLAEVGQADLSGVIYSTADTAAPPLPTPDEEPAEEYRRYVIHNGDTLDKLAARYLGNAGRALELFDLNREVLTNPHVLPIGAEILIPRKDHLRRK